MFNNYYLESNLILKVFYIFFVFRLYVFVDSSFVEKLIAVAISTRIVPYHEKELVVSPRIIFAKNAAKMNLQKIIGAIRDIEVFVKAVISKNLFSSIRPLIPII